VRYDGRVAVREQLQGAQVDASLAWLVAGIVLVITELVTGTFYLFVLGIAALVAAGVAYAGAGFLVQVVVAGAIAVAGVFWIRSRKLARATPNMPSLDVGQAVTLDSWVNRADRLARVKYRDALWDAIVDGEFRGEAGEVFYIRAVSGNTLRVAKERPA
jgi:membrane protein implicated in regulation of membrane protease activity